MSDEPTDISVGDPVGDDAGQSSYESIAKEKGWRPKEEFEGEPDSWIGAEEFVKRQPLFDKIKTQSKKLKELEKTVEALAKHYQTNIQHAREKAISELKAERKEAIELGEVSKVEEIDQRIADVQQTHDAPVVSNIIDSDVEQFVENNKDWFNKDEDMTSFAITHNVEYLKKHPGEISKSLAETLKAVKRAFPEKFQNMKKQSPSSVEGASITATGNTKYSTNRLSKEQKIVYDQLVRVHKQMSHEEYFKQLDDAGYLEG